MTTNIGADQIVGKTQFGYHQKTETANYEAMKNTLKTEMERSFRPEFLNRVDDIIVFRSLTDEDLARIIDIELVKVTKRLAEKNLKLEVTDEAKVLIREKGTNKEFGARPLRRAIEQMVEDPLAEELLRGTYAGRDTITVRVKQEGDERKLEFDATGAAPEHAIVAAGEAK
jgi:ATP-dependent Clp protease ATP-binding subunit ClpC